MINLNNSMSNESNEDPMKHESPNNNDYSTGLPSIEDLTPLSQSLIPFQLASAFKITHEIPKTMSDVTKASNSTFSSLNFNNNSNIQQPGSINPVPDPKRIRPGSEDETETVLNEEGGNNNSGKGNSAKRPRLVWTPQLHKRFVEVVAHLGLKNAVPKTIMQLMNVEGLTRENVASHLQKYRLYVKRMQENDDDSGANIVSSNNNNCSDNNLFASTPIPRFSESYSGQGNHSHNHNNNNSVSNNNSHGGEMGMLNMGFYEGGGGGGAGGGNNSMHHHHHYHHHYQQQFGGGGGGTMGQQQNNYGGNAFTQHHHLAQK